MNDNPMRHEDILRQAERILLAGRPLDSISMMGALCYALAAVVKASFPPDKQGDATKQVTSLIETMMLTDVS